MDQLLATGEQVTIALMAMTLEALGHPAVSLTGAQAGIRTDSAHTRARIIGVDATRLRAELAAGKTPVVAGFQGISPEGEVTTLGRGGSDTTAVALAAALNSGEGGAECEIYTDVDGVYTADPRLVGGARRWERINADEMLEAASLGAKVMALRAVELGRNHGVPIHVRHSMRSEVGTWIVPPGDGEEQAMEGQAVSCATLKRGIGRITVTNVPLKPGVQKALFKPLADAGIFVDDIIQNEVNGGKGGQPVADVAFTIAEGDLPDAERLLKEAMQDVDPGMAMKVARGLCKVAAIGVGMRSHSGVAATMFAALSGEGGAEAEGGGVLIENITTSEIAISCLIPEADGERALRAVHEAFGLGAAVGEVQAARGGR